MTTNCVVTVQCFARGSCKKISYVDLYPPSLWVSILFYEFQSRSCSWLSRLIYILPQRSSAEHKTLRKGKKTRPCGSYFWYSHAIHPWLKLFICFFTFGPARCEGECFLRQCNKENSRPFYSLLFASKKLSLPTLRGLFGKPCGRLTCFWIFDVTFCSLRNLIILVGFAALYAPVRCAHPSF